MAIKVYFSMWVVTAQIAHAARTTISMLFLAALTLGVLYLYGLVVEWQLRRKYGAKEPTNIEKDGSWGFGTAKRLMAAAKRGKTMELFVERYDALPRPDVPTFKCKVTGMDLFHTADPDNIKAMLATQFKDFGLGLRNKMFHPFLGDGIFTLDGNGWKHSRELLRPSFVRERISHLHLLEQHLQQFFHSIDSYNGKPFDVQELANHLSLEYSTEFLFGTPSSRVGQDTEVLSKSRFGAAFDFCQHYTSNRILLQKMYWLLSSKEYYNNCETVKEFADKFVDMALALPQDELEKRSQEKYIFLYEMAKQTRDKTLIRDQLLNVLIAGRDTTAALLTFSVMVLARNQAVFDKLRAEVVSRFGDAESSDIANITFDALKRCEYLKAFLNEVLRLYPPVPKNARVAVRDTTIPRGGGPDGNDPVLVRKGQNIIYSVYCMHRNPDYWGKDVLDFRPERWFEERCRKIGWAYLPFNGGPRICLGQQFVLTEISYILVRICQTYGGFEMGSEEVLIEALLSASVKGRLMVSTKGNSQAKSAS